MTSQLTVVPEDKLDLVSVCATCGWSPSFDPTWRCPRAWRYRYSYRAKKSIIVTHRPWCGGQKPGGGAKHKVRRMRKLTDAERAIILVGGLPALRDKYEARWRT